MKKTAILAVLLALALAMTSTLAGCGRKNKSHEDESSSSVSESDEEQEEPEEKDEPDPDEPDDEDDSSKEEEEPDEKDEGKDEEKPSKPVGPAAPGGSSSSQQAPPSSSTAPQKPSQPTTPPSSSSSRPTAPVTSSRPSSSESSSKSSSQPKKDFEATPKDITYKDQGSYSAKATYQDGVIRGDNIVLRNKVFEGDLTITSAAGSKDISLENVKVKGTLTVGGGTGWVKLYDSDINELVADKAGAKIFASKGTDVDSVVVKSKATLQEGTISKNNDGFENITVSGPTRTRTDLALQNVSVGRVTTETQSWVTVDSDSSVERFYADAPTYVKGTGDVEQLTASNDNVYYQTRPTRVTTNRGARTPRKYNSSNNYWNGGDDDDDDDDYSSRDDDKEVYIRWKDSVSDVTVVDGKSKTIRLETNGKTVKASSSNSHIVGVTVDEDDDIVLKARDTGTAKITVTASRSGYASETRSFWVEVTDTDRQKPVIGDPGYSTLDWTRGDVTVTLTVTDDNLSSVTVPGLTVRSYSNNRYSFTVTANGTYTVTAKDKSGNVTTRSVSVRNIDKTAPQVKVTSNPQFSGARVLISFQVTDSGGSGMKYDSVRVSGVTSNQLSRSGSTYSFYTSSIGTYTVTGQDNAGNSFSYPITVSATPVDDSIAIQSVTASSNDWAKKKTVAVSVSSKLPSTVTVMKDGRSVTVSNSTFEVTENGTYSITASNGQKTATSSYTETKIDNTVPSLQVGVVTIGSERFVRITASDDGSGLDFVSVNDGINDVKVDNFTSPYNHPVEQGGGSFTVKAQDKLGNIATAPITVPKIEPVAPTDTTPPVITFQPDIVDGQFAQQKQILITITDPESNIVSADAGRALPQGSRDAGLTFRYTATMENEEITVNATNSAGLTATETYTAKGIDTTGPVVTFTGPTDGTIEIEVTDTGSGVDTVTSSGGSLDGSSGTYFYTPGAGETSLTITATDNVGNQTVQTHTFTARDVTAPTASVTVTNAGTWTQEKTVTITAQDGESGVKALYVDGESVTLTNGTYTKTYGQNATFTVAAEDKAGNRSQEQTVVVDKIDRENPASPVLQYTTLVNGVATPASVMQYAAARTTTTSPIPQEFDNGTVLSLVPTVKANGNPVTAQYKIGTVVSGQQTTYSEYTTATSITLAVLSSTDTTYSFKVRSFDAAGNYSTEVEYLVKVKAPTPAATTESSREETE